MDRQWRDETTQVPTVVSNDVMCGPCDVVPSCNMRRELTSPAWMDSKTCIRTKSNISTKTKCGRLRRQLLKIYRIGLQCHSD
jgi:hypothetical protein